MAQNDFTEDKATLFGAGMVTVGVFGKTALITKGVGVVAATKAGVLAGGFICPPAASPQYPSDGRLRCQEKSPMAQG